jgi:hypothetical protein
MDSIKIIKRGVNKQVEIIRSLSLHNKPLNRQKKVKKRGGKRWEKKQRGKKNFKGKRR